MRIKKILPLFLIGLFLFTGCGQQKEQEIKKDSQIETTSSIEETSMEETIVEEKIEYLELLEAKEGNIYATKDGIYLDEEKIYDIFPGNKPRMQIFKNVLYFITDFNYKEDNKTWIDNGIVSIDLKTKEIKKLDYITIKATESIHNFKIEDDILTINIKGNKNTLRTKDYSLLKEFVIADKSPEKEEKENISSLTKAAKIVDESYNIKKGNIMLSPLSLNMALSMVTNGAGGETLMELEEFLGLKIDDYNSFSKNYMENIPSYLTIANAVWCTDDKGYEINEDLKNLLIENFNAKIESLNFVDKKSIEIINKWANENTKGMIPEILKELPFNTRFLLTNAIYFKGDWASEFNVESTKKLKFTNIDNTSKKVDTMIGTAEVYYENDNATAFGKIYKGDRYIFIGILPKKEGEFEIANLNLDSLLENKDITDVDIRMPKFEFEYENSLKQPLQNMGINNSFKNIADFTKMLENPVDDGLKIDDILQKTKIIVDEKGTEAAAVTSVTMTNDAISIDEPKEVILDRSFAFVIYDDKMGVPLFVGKVTTLE